MTTIEKADKLINLFEFCQKKVAFYTSFKRNAQNTADDKIKIEREIEYWKKKAVMIDNRIKLHLESLQNESLTVVEPEINTKESWNILKTKPFNFFTRLLRRRKGTLTTKE